MRIILSLICISCLLSCHHTEESVSVFSSCFHWVVVDNNKVLPSQYFFQAGQAQSLSLFSYMMFSSPQRSWWLFVRLLQCVNVCLVLGSPKLDTALWMPSPKLKNHFHWSASYALVSIAQYAANFNSCKGMLMILSNLLSRSFSAILPLASWHSAHAVAFTCWQGEWTEYKSMVNQ